MLLYDIKFEAKPLSKFIQLVLGKGEIITLKIPVSKEVQLCVKTDL